MNERTQLIRNIVLSEIEYERKLVAMSRVDDVEREFYCECFDNDHEIVSTWMQNYNITIEDLLAVRDEVLTKKENALPGEYEAKVFEVEKTKAQKILELDELLAGEQTPETPEKIKSLDTEIKNLTNVIPKIYIERDEMIASIQSLKTKPITWQSSQL